MKVDPTNITFKPNKKGDLLRFKNPRTNLMDGIVYDSDIVSGKYLFDGKMEITFKDGTTQICYI